MFTPPKILVATSVTQCSPIFTLITLLWNSLFHRFFITGLQDFLKTLIVVERQVTIIAKSKETWRRGDRGLLFWAKVTSSCQTHFICGHILRKPR